LILKAKILKVVEFRYPIYVFIDDLINSRISIILFVYKFSFKTQDLIIVD